MLFGGSDQMLVPCNRAVSKSGAWLHFRRECSDGRGQDSRNRVWQLGLSEKLGQNGTEEPGTARVEETSSRRQRLWTVRAASRDRSVIKTRQTMLTIMC